MSCHPGRDPPATENGLWGHQGPEANTIQPVPTLGGLSLANIALDDRLTLDNLLAEQCGVCVITNTSYCTYINETRQVEVNIKETHAQAESLHSFAKDDVIFTV